MLIPFAIVCGVLRWQGVAVTVGPEILTYSDLAKVLSIGDRKVTCAPSISDRAALVSLTNRTWTDSRKILSSALGLSVEQQSDGSWTLTVSREVRAREKKSFDSWVRAADSRAAAVLSTAREMVPDLALTTIVAQEEEIRRYRQDDDASVKSWAAHYLIGLIMNSHVDPLVAWVFTEGGGLAPLVKQDCIAYGDVNFGNRSSFPSWALFQGLPAYPNWSLMDRVWLDPVSGSVLAFAKQCAGQNSPSQMMLTSPYVLDSQIVPSRLPQAEFKSWDRMTALFPVGLSNALDVRVPLDDHPRSVAEVMDRWSKQTHQEIVMEVSPIRDEVGFTTAGASASSAKKVLWPDPTRLGSSSPDDVLLNALSNLRPWTVSNEADVLEVGNRLSFLDHQNRLPFGKLLALRKSHTIDDHGKPGHTPLSAILAYCATTSEVENLPVARGLPALVPEFLGDFYPYGRLLNALSRRQLLDIETSLKEHGTVLIPLDSVSNGTRVEFKRNLQDLALAIGDTMLHRQSFDHDALTLHPDFEAGLAQMCIRVDYRPRAGGDGTLIVSLFGRANDAEADRGLPVERVQLENVSF